MIWAVQELRSSKIAKKKQQADDQILVVPLKVSDIYTELFPMPGKVTPSHLIVFERILMQIKLISLLAQGSTEFMIMILPRNSTKLAFDRSCSRGSFLDHP